MATVADIEPASLALTPGESEVFTLTVRNDGEDVEAYHLSAVDDAAEHVVIEPDTLLVHPGETGTASATITLEHTGRWSVGELIVRFHIVPAVRPDEFLVVEAIATIQSFSDVAAVLSPPTLQGRRSAEAEIAIANAGNAHTYAGVAVSAGELVVSIDHGQAALPASSTESVDLTVRARDLLWRGDPVQHPFVVTVTPEDQPAISLEGTFTQLPLLPGWTFKAAIGVAAAAALLLVLWLGAVIWGGLRGTPVAATVSPSATETPTPDPVVDVAVEFEDPTTSKAGDDAATVLAAEVQDAPDDSLLAVTVMWPEELTLVASESTCEAWVGPEIDRELQGSPRSGDECLIDPSRSSEAELTFSTPPAGFTGEVTAAASRLVMVDDTDVAEVEYAAESEFRDDEISVPIDVQPYLFWMDVGVPEVAADGAGEVTITVHRTLDGDDPFTEMDFAIDLPEFASVNGDVASCDDWDPDTMVCFLQWFEGQSAYDVVVPLTVDGSVPNAGVLGLQGASLTVDGQTASDDEVAEGIRAAEYPLVVGTGLFGIDVALNPDSAGAGEVIEATVTITNEGFPAAVERFDEGAWMLGLGFTWPESLDLGQQPTACRSFVGNICGIRGPDPGKSVTLTLAFTVVFDAGELDDASGDVAASGVSLVFDPTTEMDRLDDREQPPREMPPTWIDSGADEFALE